MHSQYDSLGESGLRFFGKVSASIAHEIKNILAIINENAGLLEDLSCAARNGAAIDPDRLDRVSRQFTKQIVRADDIVKNMSRFAHSVDHFEAQVDLHERAVLVGNLAGRLAAMRKLAIVVEPPPMPITVTTNPFLLQNLIWLCLESAFAATPPGGTLRLAAQCRDGRPGLRIGGIDGLADDFVTRLPTGPTDLLKAAGASLAIEPEGKEVILNLI